MEYASKSHDFIHRKIAGSDVLIAVGNNIANFNGYIQLNSTASYIWDHLDKPKSIDELKNDMIAEFGVDEETALADLNEFIQLLVKNEMVDMYE